MFRIITYTLLLAAVGLTVVSGLLHGRLSQRWGADERGLIAGEQLERFPDQFGDWQVEESYELSEVVANELQCTGYVNRRYLNQQTGESVNVALLVGPSGPTSVHIPEICYSSRDFRLTGQRQRTRIRGAGGAGGAEPEFWTLMMESTGLDGHSLRVHYAWSPDGQWQAVESPRLAYAGQPLLYKIQLAVTVPPGTDPAEYDADRRFLEQFVPAFNQHLFGTEE